MSDRLTIEQRHNNMAAIRGRDTKPEILVEFHSQHIYLPVSLIYSLRYHFNPISLNFLEQNGIEMLVLPDNIDRATQKGFKVCFQTDYQEKLRGHFYIDIYIAAIVVLVSCLPLFSFLISFFKRLLPLQGAGWIALIPRVYPGLGASAPSGRA